MRVHDDYAWGGGKTRGALAFAFNREDPMELFADFLTFYLLAKRAQVVAADWEWRPFVLLAVDRIHMLFEKSDAQEKYGSEDVFAALMGNGRSLRATSEAVYGSSVQDQDDSAMFNEAHDEVMEWTYGDQRGEHIFKPVGGYALWHRFLQILHGFHRVEYVRPEPELDESDQRHMQVLRLCSKQMTRIPCFICSDELGPCVGQLQVVNDLASKKYTIHHRKPTILINLSWYHAAQQGDISERYRASSLQAQ